MKTLRLRRLLLSLAVLILMLSLLAFSGCGASISEGVVIDKTIGEPLIFHSGQLKMLDPRKSATNYCIWVQGANGKIAGFYVSEQVYNEYSIGDWFVYDRTRHFAV